MLAGTLGRFYQLPAFFYRSGSRYFYGNMFALLHGINSHRHMPIPWSSNKNQIDIIAIAHFFPGIGIIGINFRFVRSILYHLLGFLYFLGAYITYAIYFYTFHKNSMS